MKTIKNLTLILCLVLATAGSARAQTSSNDKWNVGIYPVFGWIPLDIDIKVDVPPFDDGSGGGSGEILDGRFDGAFLAGFYASNGRFRIDHREGTRWLDVHATFEGGGFGAGTDAEWAGMIRFDIKPARHFGITAGYNFLYFKGENTTRNQTFKFEQSLHGPLAGIGLYF